MPTISYLTHPFPVDGLVNQRLFAFVPNFEGVEDVRAWFDTRQIRRWKLHVASSFRTPSSKTQNIQIGRFSSIPPFLHRAARFQGAAWVRFTTESPDSATPEPRI